MKDIESRLTDALAARAAEVEPHDEDDALNRISERVTMNRRRAITLLGVAAAIVVVIGAIALLNRGDDKKQQITVASNSTSNTSTTNNTTPANVIPQSSPAIWPFASSSEHFATPEDAAKSFAVDYLGMTNAKTGKAVGRDVPVFPNSTGTARTVVHTEQRASDFVVVGAEADQITVDTPKPDDPLSSSLTISGKSVAFEATLGVELRAYGSTTPVFKGIAMGGSTELQPFSTTVTPPATDQPLVLVIYESDASGQGAVTKATVIPLDGPQPPTTFVATTTNGAVMLFDFAGHIQRPLNADETVPTSPTSLPANVSGSLATVRGRFATVAFFDGTQIASYNPANGAVVPLVTPAAKPISLDADESGRHLLWVDVNHDLWTWSGGDPVKVGTGFTSAAW